MGRARHARSLNSQQRFACVLLSLTPAIPAGAEALRPESSFNPAPAAADPVAWVLAQADAAPAPPAPAPAPPAQGAAQQIPASRSDWMTLFVTDTVDGRRVQVAPLRWRGNVGLEQRMTRFDGGDKLNQTLEFASLNMATYVGQPWLMQVRANIGIVGSQQNSNGENGIDSINGHLLGDRSANLTGGGTVSLFPNSRFPFNATVDVTDSRTSGEAVTADYTNRMAAVRQSYRTPLGDQVYMASLEHSALTSSSFGHDNVTSINGTMQRTFAAQVLDMAASYSENRRSAQNDGTDIARVSVIHSWRPDELMTVDSFASFSGTQLLGTVDSSSRFSQLNSFATWRPEEDSPLFVTGGLRASDARFDGGGEAALARTFGGNVAASYAISQSAQVVGTFAVADVQTESSSSVVSTESVAGHYSPPPIPLGNSLYSWNTSLSANNQTGGADGSQHTVVAQAGHQLSHGWSFGEKLSVNGSLNQAYAIDEESIRPVTRTLQNSASVAVRTNPTTGSDMFLAVTAGDSKSQGGREDHLRLLNVQLTGNLQLGVFSILTANLTLQQIRQKLDGEEEERSSVLRSGTATYQHLRLFGIQRLRFALQATFNDMTLESRLQGDVNAPHDQFSRLYESRLLYDIGRLELRLGTRIATLDGKTDHQIYFRVNRQFGLF